jgi:4-alpha-glucanotransferase
VCYTGTHDNYTLKGWLQTLKKSELEYIKLYLGVQKKRQIPDAMIRLAFSSCADTAIVQIQDLLGSEPSARMNTPSTLGTNWKFRIAADDLNKDVILKLKFLNKIFNR